MGHRPRKEGPESERLLSASSRVKRLSARRRHGAAAAFYHFLLGDIRQRASEEPWEIRKTCFWLAGWKGSEKFLAESGRVDEGGKERRGGKLIGRDFGAVSLKKNKGVAHHGMNRRR